MPSKDSHARLSFEEAMRELKLIVDQLEAGNVPLEDSVALYEKGTTLKIFCEKKLKEAKERIDKIVLDEKGNPESLEALTDKES